MVDEHDLTDLTDSLSFESEVDRNGRCLAYCDEKTPDAAAGDAVIPEVASPVGVPDAADA
jgi:hypothetical protein